MKAQTYLVIALALLCFFVSQTDAQRRRSTSKKRAAATRTQRPPEVGKTAVVVDEKLSALREAPSLYAVPIQRMRRGRRVHITAVRESGGVKFFRVDAMPSATGWIQSEAVFGTFRSGDEDRLATLVQAASGFDQIELAVTFLEMYPRSQLRPSVLLLFGDLVETTAVKLSRDAGRRINRREIAATAAPEHTYYLNFVSLDRYRRLGIVFVFNKETRRFHYNGASWKEIVEKYPSASEVAEAQKRLDSLTEKMSLSTAVN